MCLNFAQKLSKISKAIFLRIVSLSSEIWDNYENVKIKAIPSFPFNQDFAISINLKYFHIVHKWHENRGIDKL